MTDENLKSLFAGLAHLRAARTELELSANSIRANRSEFGVLSTVVDILDVLIQRVDREYDWLQSNPYPEENTEVEGDDDDTLGC